MKRVLTILFVVVFFLVLLGLVLFKLFYTPETKVSTQDQKDVFASVTVSNVPAIDVSPEEITRQCFTSYIKYYTSVDTISYELVSNNPTIQRCFTSSLIASWEESYAVSETDPILISGEYYDSWITQIRATVVSRLSQTSSVELVLGTGSEEHHLFVGLLYTNTGWHISSVSAGEQF